MTSEQIQQNNELIARFMGLKIREEKWRAPHPTTVWLVDAYWTPAGQMEYHSSWDWLMPVVEKIEGLGHKTIIAGGDSWGDYMNIMYGKSREETAQRLLSVDMETKAMGMGSSKIVSVYAAVVNFIIWHNEQNKQP